MAITVSKVTAEFKSYVSSNRGKARFKLAIASPNKVLVSTKSFEYESNLTQILSDYAGAKNGQTIDGFLFERGVRYKINGNSYASNYIEVVVKVSDIAVCSESSRLKKFIDSESRECHDRNSRDKHVMEMLEAITPCEIEPNVPSGEDA